MTTATTNDNAQVNPSFGQLFSDILSEIFTYCSNERSILDCSETLWSLIQVSKHWREVALDTPSLWVSIFLDLDIVSRSHVPKYIPMLAFALDHARNRPLHVKIYTTELTASPNIQPLLDIVFAHCSQWSTWDLRLPNLQNIRWNIFNVIPLPALHPQTNDFTFLRELSIDGANMSFAEKDLALFVPLRFATQLRTMRIRSLEPLNLGFIRGLLPWHQITHLEIGGHPGSQVLDILSATRHLESLTIDSYAKERTPDFQNALIVTELKTLRCLDIPLEGERMGMCRWLKVPSLEHLTLRGAYSYHTADPTDEMLSRSSPALATFSIAGSSVMDVTIERLIRRVPLTKTLKLEGAFFSHIFDKIATNELLPCLEHLVVVPKPIFGSPLSPPLASILALARSRISPNRPAGVSRLRSLEVYAVSKALDVSLTHDLKALKDFGLETQVVRSRPSRFLCRKPFDPSMVGWMTYALYQLQSITPAPQAADISDRNVRENMPLFDHITSILENTSVSKKQVEFPLTQAVLWRLHGAHIPEVLEQQYHIADRLTALERRWRALP
ncbi:hypothetical protein VNI00_010458 [Paramarasmius palmivorus]|uniref:F-box domain-containing protein n=1 Tax=Paramarasmius palmivorus TaxID=297713 RepID=A0AAW0CIQ9_9AGAR